MGKYTTTELAEELYNMNFDELVEFIDEQGLEIWKPTPILLPDSGCVYRRLHGSDMAMWDKYGEKWTPVVVDDFQPLLGDRDKTCRWVKVLDEGHNPVLNGEQIELDAYGNRVA